MGFFLQAADTPWLSSMSKSNTYLPSNGPSSPQQTYDPNPPTSAAFSPPNSSGYSASSKQRSSVIVHRKSPLLVATPPQITRALAHAHPFLLPLTKLMGLISWDTEDPWESFLMVAVFWGVTLYGSAVVRYATPIVSVSLMILGMYSRRYSPLSSTSKTGEKHEGKGHRREHSETTSRQHQTLDDIVETLQQFTWRCNILLGPFLTLTDFLSTQRTPTSATTRPALTTLFFRILMVTPLWIILTLPPLYILTPRRIILTIGTITLTWHSRPARVARVILWRSILLRRISTFVTGLDFGSVDPVDKTESIFQAANRGRDHSQARVASELAAKAKKRRAESSGIKLTFIIYENQRRWIGLGWTKSLFGYERQAWTDELLHPVPSKDEFELPKVEGGASRWRWVKGSEWQIERGNMEQHARAIQREKRGGGKDDNEDGGGWIFYDNKWEDGRLEDGWGRYTRRRKWFRDAELVEDTSSTEPTPSVTPVHGQSDAEDEKRMSRSPYQSPKMPTSPQTPQRTNPATPQRQQANTPTTNSATPKASLEPGKDSAVKTPATALEKDDDAASMQSKKTGSGSWFRPAINRARSDSKGSSSQKTAQLSNRSDRSRDDPTEDVYDKWQTPANRASRQLGLQEDIAMSLG